MVRCIHLEVPLSLHISLVHLFLGIRCIAQCVPRTLLRNNGCEVVTYQLLIIYTETISKFFLTL